MAPDFLDVYNRITMQSASDSEQLKQFAKKLFDCLPPIGEAYAQVFKQLYNTMLTIDRGHMFELVISADTFDHQFKPLVSKCGMFVPTADRIERTLARGNPQFVVCSGATDDDSQQIHIQYLSDSNRRYFKIKTKNVFAGYLDETYQLIGLIADDYHELDTITIGD